MAGEFKNQDVGGLPVASINVQPVVDQSSVIGSNSLAQGITALSSGANDLFKGLVSSRNSKIVGQFAQEQLKLADAVDQGLLSSKEARMKARANFATVAANNPTLFGELAKAHGEIIETAGLGKIIAEGTDEENAFKKQYDLAAAAGYTAPGIDPIDSVNAWRTVEREKERISLLKNRIELNRARLGEQSDLTSLESSKIDLENKKLQKGMRDSLRNLADPLMTQSSAYFKKIKADVDAGIIKPEDALLAIQQRNLTIDQLLARFPEAGSDYVNALATPIKAMGDVYKGWVTGETSADVAQKQLDALTAKTSLQLVVDDPEAVKTIALTKLLGEHTNLALLSKQNEISMRLLDSVVKGKFNPVNEGEDHKPFYDVIRDTLKNGGKDTVGEQDEAVNNMLYGLTRNVNNIEGPKQLTQFADFIASTEFAGYIKRNGGIPSDYAQDAETVLQEFYLEKAYPAIQEEYTNAQVRQGTGFNTRKTDIKPVIQPTFNGTGVVFMPVKGAQRVGTDVDPKVRSLNNKLAPVINRIIKINAHMGGNTDYKASWESIAPMIFPEMFAEETSSENAQDKQK